MPDPKTLGILGGTFDPIHLGHCRAALEIQQQLQLEQVRLIPCKHPPHRPPPTVHAHHRLNMVRLALEKESRKKNSLMDKNLHTPAHQTSTPPTTKLSTSISSSKLTPTLLTDDREIQRDGPSYTIDTLMSLRAEFPHTALFLIVGVDAFLSLPSWYQWEKIIQLTNIVVMYRSGWNLPESGVMIDLLKHHALKPNTHIQRFTHGKITSLPITMLDIQASHIRTMLAQNISPRFLLPEKVLDYIQKHQLYGYNADSLTSTPKGVTQI